MLLPQILLLGASLVGTPFQGVANYDSVIRELSDLRPLTARTAQVTNLVLRRDVAEFRLEDGTLHVLSAVAGRSVGVIFIGRGTAILNPSIRVEREHLNRLLDVQQLDAAFTSLLLLFADTTLHELERHLVFEEGALAKDAGKRVRDALEQMVDPKKRSADVSILTALLNQHENDLFYARFETHDHGPLVFRIDPYQPESVGLFRRAKGPGNHLEVVVQSRRQHEKPIEQTDPPPDLVSVTRYRIDNTIANNLSYSARAEMAIESLQDDVRWIPFLLFSDLKVDSVYDGAGAALLYARPAESPWLWVRFEPVLKQAEARLVHVVYGGALIERRSLVREMFEAARRSVTQRLATLPQDQWFFIRSTSTWFPRYGTRAEAYLDLTFHTPSKLLFSSVGDLVERRVDGDVRTTRWVTRRPESHASFNIGDFAEFKVTDERIPPVTVHMALNAHRELDAYFLAQKDPQEQVATDIVNSLAFFTDLFGKPVFDSFYATEIPYSHGQAFPGMIHLAWSTFQWTTDEGYDEMFRAHEMAHQWWGIGVDPLTYRDAWLSEGFSEFSGLWYMQVILRDNLKYFEQLERWRKELIKRRDDVGPIWLGPRVATSDAPWAYNLVVYQKGAWVVHMIRNLMLDFGRSSEEAFRNMLRDFYETYRGRRATTGDLQRIVERHIGQPMDWFFEQWVRGTEIPVYEWASTTERSAEGKWLVRLRIRQRRVSPEFQMYVPVRLDFGAQGTAFIRVFVSGEETQVELPPLDLEPTAIVFNPLESVLAEVKQSKWD